MKSTLLETAKFLSLIFSPALTIPAALALFLLLHQLPGVYFLKSIALFFGIGVLPVFLVFLYLKKIGKISDWDISKRKERHLFNVIALILGFVVLGVLSLLQINFPIQVLWFFLIWFGIYTMITFFWKISAHTAGITLFVLFLTKIFPGLLWLGLILIGLMVWARVYRKNHTLAQAIGGIVLSAIVFFMFRL